MSPRLDNVIAIGILAVLCFAALAHGAVEAWSIALLEILIGGLILLWGFKAILDQRLNLKIPAATWPLTIFFVFGLIQSLRVANKSLSQDVEATRGVTVILFAALVVFLLCANFFTNRERLRVMVSFLAIYGFAFSLFALIQHFTWNGKFYWLRTPLSDLSSPFGSFANHNHFAGYLELLIGLPVALVIAGGIRREERVFYGFVASIMGMMIIFSLSRGGWFSLFVELMFITILSRRLSGKTKANKTGSSAFWRGTSMVAVILAIIIGSWWIGADPVLNRISANNQDNLSNSRVWIWKDSWRVFTAYPILGAGIGSFQTVYPHQSAYDGYQGFVAQSHNDYLQVLADSGMIGGALALWFILLVLRDVWRGVRARDPLIAGLALGSGAGVMGILAHSLIDFNLQLPSNALMFLLLCSVASFCSQKVSEQEINVEFPVNLNQSVPRFPVGVSR